MYMSENFQQEPEESVTGFNNNNLNSSSSSTPKKRAESWVQEETRTLINLRRERDLLFNTSKSNKHLWDDISIKMREKGFDRSPTMCTDKWRNLLKEFKKAKLNNNQDDGNVNVNANAKMSYYMEIDEILKERSKNSGPPCNNNADEGGSNKVDSFMQFADKGIDDGSLSFGPVEAGGRSGHCLERSLDHDGHPPSAIAAAEAVAGSGVSPWNWRETPRTAGEQSNIYDGKVITVKMGDYTKKVGIDGTPDAIKEAIKSAFKLRTRRAFWLEDEYGVIRTLDRAMPLGHYTLHVDEGVTVKVCLYEESNNLPAHVEAKTFYTKEDFHHFLSRHGWSCLKECRGYRVIENMDDLVPGAIYRGGPSTVHGMEI